MSLSNMTPHAAPRKRLTPRPLLSLATLLASCCLALLGTAAGAQAAADHYCVSCTVADNTVIYDATFYRLDASYFHYLGAGDRYLGAGSLDYANYVFGTNEVTHFYNYTGAIRASAWNASGHPITANAHADVH